MYVKREVTENSLLNFRPITTMKSKTSKQFIILNKIEQINYFFFK